MNPEDRSNEIEAAATTTGRPAGGTGNVAGPGGQAGPNSGDDLLRPNEVAEIFGVRTPTVARWAREGKLRPLLTPGGHRRYPRSELTALRDDAEVDEARERMEEDAARLYAQGWSIRQVADRFDVGYGVMRRILVKRTTLRHRSGL